MFYILCHITNLAVYVLIFHYCPLNPGLEGMAIAGYGNG